jgi:hypothetical protein
MARFAIAKDASAWFCNGDKYGESMPTGNGLMDSQLAEAYVRAQAARKQSQVLAEQLRAAKRDTALILQLVRNAWDEAELIHEAWLIAHPDANRLGFSAQARLRARLKSMPVIEQAKGIIMAQCGWPEDQAFDALRRASQRQNIKLRDLAAIIVAKTARPVFDEAQPGSPRVASPVREELASV